MKTSWADQIGYPTLDGSTIRELIHPSLHGDGRQSLAEARIPASTSTLLHLHEQSEEVYHVTEGSGWMQLGTQRFPIRAGDSIRIDPGTPHKLINSAGGEMVVLCCCCPPYSHDDTRLLEQSESSLGDQIST